MTYASCQGLTLHNRVRHATSRCATCTWAPQGRRAPSCWRQPSRTGSTAPPGSSMRRRTSKSTPHCLPISHTCRGAGRVPEEAALQVNLALDVLALGAHLDGALELALKLGAGGPRKGLQSPGPAARRPRAQRRRPGTRSAGGRGRWPARCAAAHHVHADQQSVSLARLRLKDEGGQFVEDDHVQ